MRKLKLSYDNLEDAKTKLAGTYCMYKDKATLVKTLASVGMDYAAIGNFLSSGRPFECLINEPEFNCSEYNIGYVNIMHAAAWFYRKPMKQWKQGLRNDQIGLKYSKRAFADISFGASKPIACMLENSYPSFKDSTKLLKEGDAAIVAFHKDFAMTYDPIHSDFILEYKGTNIGFTKNMKNLELMEEHMHLTESLKEAVG